MAVRLGGSARQSICQGLATLFGRSGSRKRRLEPKRWQAYTVITNIAFWQDDALINESGRTCFTSPAAKPNATKENFSDLSEPVANGQPEIPQFRHLENNLSESLSVGLITCVFGPARVGDRKRDNYFRSKSKIQRPSPWARPLQS